MAMPSFAKLLPPFLGIILLFSGQSLARESRFFSKATRETTQPTTKPIAAVEPKEEDQPTFLPQTSENAPYGLYGRQADLHGLPSTTATATTTTTQKYTAQPQYQPQREVPTFDRNTNRYYGNTETFETKEETVPSTTTEPEFYNPGDRKNYATELKGIDGYTKGDAYGNGYYYNTKKGGSYYNGEKQGMSDTRFMENGRYFYDLNSERTPATYNYGAAPYRRAPEYYNSQGYYTGSTVQGRFNDKYYQNSSPNLQDEEDFEFDP